MATSPKFPIERRRRHNPAQNPQELTQQSAVPPMRRESDVVRARLQRWIELADRALGLTKRNGRNGDKSHHVNPKQ